MFRNLFFIIILSALLFPLLTEAAILYLEPNYGQYYKGDTFIVEVRIDTETDCVNTIEANLSFAQDILEATDFSQGNSVLSLWLKRPEILSETGIISFIGGIPGGFCGRIAGDPGKSNLLGKIIFKAKQSGNAIVKPLNTSQVLLNDGFGTVADLTTQGALFSILPGTAEVIKEEWQEELDKDTILPESFEIEISHDDSIFDGKYFIIFSTNDKQTGVDYYQVKEGAKDWRIAESPYLLEDQSLESIIKVKAVDKAGNERMAQYLPERKPFPYSLLITFFLLVIIIWGIYKVIKKR